MRPQTKQQLKEGSSLVIALSCLIMILMPVSIHVIYTQWDRSMLRSPVCRISPPPSQKLPKMVVIVGAEGSGHDLFEYLFAALPSAVAIERFDPQLHLTHSPAQEAPPADPSNPQHSTCPLLPYARRVHDLGVGISAKIKDKAPGANSTYARVRDPLPMGRIRTPLARMDLLSLATFHGLYYDLRVLVLLRNLTSSVMWSITRSFHNEDLGLQLRLLEDSFVYIDASLRLLPCNTYAILDVDWLEQNYLSSAGQLAKLLDIPKVGKVEMALAMQVAFTRWDQGLPTSISSVPEPTFGGQKIDYFFAQRSGLWPLLHAARSRPVFVPASPASWPHNFL